MIKEIKEYLARTQVVRPGMVANKRCNRRLKRAFYLLARRLSDIIFAMMLDNTAYDPERTLARIWRRREGEAAISHLADSKRALPHPESNYRQVWRRIKREFWILT
jgi:hypothetical protein